MMTRTQKTNIRSLTCEMVHSITSRQWIVDTVLE